MKQYKLQIWVILLCKPPLIKELTRISTNKLQLLLTEWQRQVGHKPKIHVNNGTLNVFPDDIGHDRLIMAEHIHPSSNKYVLLYTNLT